MHAVTDILTQYEKTESNVFNSKTESFHELLLLVESGDLLKCG